MRQELHEQKIRGELHELVESYRIVQQLVAGTKEIEGDYLFINKEDVMDMCFDIYTIMLREIRSHGGKI